jgi:hypothetical protein
MPGPTSIRSGIGASVFYEVMVRSFVDSNGDGSGDPQ